MSGPVAMRVWPSGQAAAFQAAHMGSIPMTRSNNKQGDAPMPASIGAPPQYTRFSRVPLAQALPLSGERVQFA